MKEQERVDWKRLRKRLLGLGMANVLNTSLKRHILVGKNQPAVCYGSEICYSCFLQ